MIDPFLPKARSWPVRERRSKPKDGIDVYEGIKLRNMHEQVNETPQDWREACENESREYVSPLSRSSQERIDTAKAH
jgi:hypothetical protein